MKSFKDHIKKEAQQEREISQLITDALYIGQGKPSILRRVHANKVINIILFKPIDAKTYYHILQLAGCDQYYSTFNSDLALEQLLRVHFHEHGFEKTKQLVNKFIALPVATTIWFQDAQDSQQKLAERMLSVR